MYGSLSLRSCASHYRVKTELIIRIFKVFLEEVMEEYWVRFLIFMVVKELVEKDCFNVTTSCFIINFLIIFIHYLQEYLSLTHHLE